jgi:dihydroorotase-like cyclic amidohydrolase
MKEKIFINARIIDPSQKMDEIGSLILNEKGKVKAIGKNVKQSDANKDAEIIDVKKKYFNSRPSRYESLCG